VPDREIIQAFKAAGGDPRNLSYLPAKSNFKGARNFYVNTSRRPTPESGQYKGSSAKGALYQRDWEALAQQAARSQGQLSAHKGVDALISTFGRSKPDGTMFSFKEAQREAQNVQASTGEQFTPMRVLRGQSGAAAERIKGGLDVSQMPEMLSKARPGDSNVVLFPAELAKRIRQHEEAARGPLPNMFGAVNQRFRHAVLPTSPRWALGNVSEMLLRTAIEDPTLFRSIMHGKHLEAALKQVGGADAVNRLRASAGAGNLGSQAKLDIHRVPEHQITRAIHALRQAPGPKQVADAWDLYKRAVFGANSKAEDLLYYAGLGKEALREHRDFTGAWHKSLKLGDAAYRDIAKGLTQTNNIERYARTIDDMRGRYSNLSPTMRAFTTTLTPFAPWYLNALHFVFVTLPVRHPIKTGILSGLNAGQKKKLDDLGLSLFAQSPAPAFMQGSIPTGKGLLRASQYSPFGAFTDLPGNAANLVLPQFTSALGNVGGLNWKGQQIKDANGQTIKAGDPRLAGVALNTIAESFVPFLRHTRQVQEKGGSSQDTSNVFSPKTKPGTSKSFLEGFSRTFNPLYVAARSSSTSDPIKALNAKYGLGPSAGPSVSDLNKKYGLGP
jgi:hypothetical protein